MSNRKCKCIYCGQIMEIHKGNEGYDYCGNCRASIMCSINNLIEDDKNTYVDINFHIPVFFFHIWKGVN